MQGYCHEASSSGPAFYSWSPGKQQKAAFLVQSKQGAETGPHHPESSLESMAGGKVAGACLSAYKDRVEALWCGCL